MTIESVDAWEVLDSRGNPTVACRVRLAGGASGTASVPSGASTGRHEAHELRDGDGRGVQTAVANVRTELAAAVRGAAADDQAAVDALLREADGTPDLSRLGANATLAVSLAVLHAAAAAAGREIWQLFASEPLLPMPMVNIISGGAHAGGLIDIQDFLVVPVGAQTFRQALAYAGTVRRHTAAEAARAGLPSALVADEGGLSGALASNRAALELLARGVESSGLRLGDDIAFAIDVAANQLADGTGRYALRSEGRSLSAAELVAEVRGWSADFPIVSVEDVLGEDDWDGWAQASRDLAGLQLLGDDLFATSTTRLLRGADCGVANAVLVKANQAGTLSDAIEVVAVARERGYATVVSARSGETEDSWLADLAVGWRAGQIKVGSTTRSERTAKWNRLLQIEHEHAATARFAGTGYLAGPARHSSPAIREHEMLQPVRRATGTM